MTTSPQAKTEAALESRITRALATALPHLADDEIEQQRYFTVRVGRNKHVFDSAAQWSTSGRADIILRYDQRPLAVLEIKRETVSITREDYEQAQSYANQLTPRPPLVIVTNGDETQCFDANTGAEWDPGSDAEFRVKGLLANAAKVAKEDMCWAIEALLGRDMDFWPEAVRACTARLLDNLTDPPGAAERPVARDLLFPRKAAFEVEAALRGEKLFTLVYGPPAIGKTNLLRELAKDTEGSDELAMLMLRGSGPGLFQAVANLFAAAFEWSLTPHDARQWLRRMSASDAGPRLVIAVDGVEPGSLMADDLHELASFGLGPKLKIICTLDQPECLTRTSNGRDQTGISAASTDIELSALSLVEFGKAVEILAEARINFAKGAEYCLEYRMPWVLRTLYDGFVRDPRYGDEQTVVIIPAALNLNLIDMARKNYDDHLDLLRGYRLLARDAISDNGSKNHSLALAQSNGFVIRRDFLSTESREILPDLRKAGFIRMHRIGGEDVVLPAIPALFTAELADAAAEILVDRGDDAVAAGQWLGQRLESVYLGDLIGAQAIRTLANTTGGLDQGLIEGLLSIEPKSNQFENGQIATEMSDGQIVHLKIEGEKAWLTDNFGNIQSESFDIGDDRCTACSDVTGWMILGQLARLPMATDHDDSDRVDAKILFEIGQCPFPLLRGNVQDLGYQEHDVGDLGHVLCAGHGPIEATTLELVPRIWTGR